MTELSDRTDTEPAIATGHVEAIRRGPRLFATAADEPRARRPGDAVVVLVAGLGLIALSLAEEPLPRFVQSVVDMIHSLPGLLLSVWQLCADLLVLWALVILTATVVRRRWSVGRDAVLAIIVATVIGLFAHHYAVGGWDIWGGLKSRVGAAALPGDAHRRPGQRRDDRRTAPVGPVPPPRPLDLGHRRAGRGDGQRDVADRQPGGSADRHDGRGRRAPDVRFERRSAEHRAWSVMR